MDLYLSLIIFIQVATKMSPKAKVKLNVRISPQAKQPMVWEPGIKKNTMQHFSKVCGLMGDLALICLNDPWGLFQDTTNSG